MTPRPFAVTVARYRTRRPGDAGALIELFGFLDEPNYNYDIVTP
jgi:hypothetical protein